MGHVPLALGGRIDWAAMRQRPAELLKRLEADFEANTLLKRLSVAQKHLVEIAGRCRTTRASSSWTSRLRRFRRARSAISSP